MTMVKKKKLRWIGVDCGSADHPMNTKIRDRMPKEARHCDAHMKEKLQPAKKKIRGSSTELITS